MAINNKNTYIAELLLEQKNIDVNLQDKLGDTALHMALKKGSKIDLIEYILKNKNIDINLQDKSGNAALHLLALKYFGYENKRLLDNFLSYNHINLNLKNKSNETALDLAENEHNYAISNSLRQFSKSQKIPTIGE